MLQEQFEITREAIDKLLQQAAELKIHETGEVVSVGKGVAIVSGLPGVRAQELVIFNEQVQGIAFNLDVNNVGVVLLGQSHKLAAGSQVRRTGRVVDIPVGRELLGRVINPNGEILDDGGPLQSMQRMPIEREAPAILDRAPVVTPMETGIKVIDTLIPIGHGQRELILGDRQTGKTTIALDTIINQRDRNVISIYCAIGQRSSSVARVIETLRNEKVMEQCVVVVAAGEEPPGLQYIAPYAATSIAEYFMQLGHDVLIVYDDLTKHARTYRELSLLLRRPPGREAFPGDVFYIHSRLLERSTQLRSELGGGSLTSLPIVETEAENISAYIPTNLVSITDGQIYLSPTMFQKGLLPAVDVGKSVSRVGGKTQLPAYRSVASELRLNYSQFEELEAFARFGTRLDAATRKAIERGQRVREIFRQTEHSPLSSCSQIVVLLALIHGLLDEVEINDISATEKIICALAAGQMTELCQAIHGGEKLEKSDIDTALDLIRKELLENTKESKPHA